MGESNQFPTAVPLSGEDPTGNSATGKALSAGLGNEATITLVQRICAGDKNAANALTARYLPILRRWAHGRLPTYARSLSETDDLVQTTLIRALNNAAELRLEHAGSFLAYLRQILLNQVRDAIRAYQRQTDQHLTTVEFSEQEIVDPTDRVEGYSDLQAYERAMGQLSKRQQELIIMRLEFGLSYAEIAADVGTTPDAVRMTISRAILKLTTFLDGQ